MNKSHPRSSTRVLSMGLVLTLLALLSTFASAQTTDSSVSVIEMAKITASDGAADDQFGFSSSISGDTVVVGAPRHDDKGAAYVFERNAGGPGNWGQVAKLTSSDGAADDRFGWSVSVSDGTVVVGAPRDDDAGDHSGSAYLFEEPGAGWANMTETAKLTASDGVELDGFGWSVSISGDTVAVGSPFDDDNGDMSGSAYLFGRPQSGWTNMTQTAKLTASDGTNLDYLGRSVAISGDTVVAGAQGADYDYTYSGSAYLFERPETGWVDMTETVRLMSSDAADEDWFGSSVSISGDVVVVGAPYDDDIGFTSGSAYLFGRDAGGLGNWGQVAKLTASDADSQDQFGGSVSISGDTVVIGAVFDEELGDRSGSAYLFRKPLAGWTDMTETVKLTASDGAEDDRFGNSVSISGSTIAACAPRLEDYGSAYLFFNFEPVTSVYLPVVLRGAP
jgi:hypothetical protein